MLPKEEKKKHKTKLTKEYERTRLQGSCQQEGPAWPVLEGFWPSIPPPLMGLEPSASPPLFEKDMAPTAFTPAQQKPAEPCPSHWRAGDQGLKGNLCPQQSSAGPDS
jgi:hypothetical protein